MTWPRAILFDLDGTLADTAPDIADALNMLLAEQGSGEFSLEAVTAMVGGGVPLLLERALSALGENAAENDIPALTARFLEIYQPRAADKSRLFPGVREALDTFHAGGRELGVCTNKPEAVTWSILEQLGVSGLFGAVIGGDTLAVKKPDAAPVLEALARLECAIADGVMVGDSAADSGAARAAGIPVLLVSYGYTRTPVRQIDNDGVVDSFDELEAAINQLRKSRARS